MTQRRNESKACSRLAVFVISLWTLSAHAQDQLEQEPLVIKGNQGMPKTLYILPWKRIGAPLASESLKGEIGEETEWLERDLFQRELELQRRGYSVEPPSPDSPTGTSKGPTAVP
jgi:hypothetical protein